MEKGQLVYYPMWPFLFAIKEIRGGYAILEGYYNIVAVSIDRLTPLEQVKTVMLDSQRKIY